MDNLGDLLTQLEATQVLTLQYFELSTLDLTKSYAPNKWNNQQILHHLADTETVFYERIRRTIASPNQTILGFNQDVWARVLDYENEAILPNKNIYQAVRPQIIALAKKFYQSHGANEFIHNETGKQTLKGLFEKVALHNRHHLNQIESTL